MQRITVDEENQAAWLPKVRRFHPEAKLQVRDAAGLWHTLISIDRVGSSWNGFEGPIDRFVLTASRPLRRTNWSSSLTPTTLLHLRVDSLGQLELWSDNLAITKILDEQPSHEDWPRRLLHVFSPNARGLKSLLASGTSETVKSLDVGEGLITADIQGIGALVNLESLSLNDDSHLTDLGPIAALSHLKMLRLRFCREITDVGALADLTELQSLELGSCHTLRVISPLQRLSRLRALHISGGPISDLDSLARLGELRALSLAHSSDLRDLRPLAALQQLETLNLSGCAELSDLSPLARLTQLKSLDLSSCDHLTDLTPLQHLGQLENLDLGSCEEIADLAPLARMTRLRSLDLSGCRRVTDIASLAKMSQLESLQLGRHDQLDDLRPLRHLVQLTKLDLTNCKNLRDLGPIAGLSKLTALDLSGCTHVQDLEPLAGLSQLTSLSLRGCVNLKDLRPLAGLDQMTSLNLYGCKGVHDLGPLAELCQLTSLDLGRCANLGDLGPLAGLGKLTTLKITDSDNLVDVGPLAGLVQLTSLSLAGCHRLRNVGPLCTLRNLNEIDLSACPHLALISGIDELPTLVKVRLHESTNVRDVDALSKLPSLRDLKSAETAPQDSVLLACATRRGDEDLRQRLETSAASLHLSRSTGLHAQRLVEAVKVLVDRPGADSDVFREVSSAMRARTEITPKTWGAFFAELARAPDPTLRPAFEVAMSDLPLAESDRVLAPALLALSDVPASAKAWALNLAQRALLPVAASATHAREVAPAAAVFFHARGLEVELDDWLNRGSVAQVPAWRDRVLLALLGRELQLGEVVKARHLLGEVKTPERRDEAGGMLVEHLAKRAEFRDAAAELDAIVDRARRASAAAEALSSAPAFAGERHAGLSLLLALDGDPDTLADVLAAMAQQAPDSELVRQIAAVFAPTAGVELGEAVDAMLAHQTVVDVTKAKQLAELRRQAHTTPEIKHQVLARGMSALLRARNMVDDAEAAEVTTVLLGRAS